MDLKQRILDLEKENAEHREVGGGGFMDENKKQVSVSDLLLEEIKILGVIRQRALQLIESTPLEERQDFQDALTRFDYSAQALKQKYESRLLGQQ